MIATRASPRWALRIPRTLGPLLPRAPLAHTLRIPNLQPSLLFSAGLRHDLTHIFRFSIFYGESLRRTLKSSPPLWIMEGLASYLGEDETNIARMVIRDAVVNNYIPPLKLMD